MLRTSVLVSFQKLSKTCRHRQADQPAPMALPLPIFVIMLLSVAFRASLALSQSAPAEFLLSTDQITDSLHRSDFPKNFIFGASTSSYQVEGGAREGGRGLSTWDVWSHTGHAANGATGDVTADQFHHFEEDIESLAWMNMDAYKFSISWTRIFPDGHGPDANKDGIAYYNRLIDFLLEKGIEPYVTLFHFDLPQTFQDSFGGWVDRQMVDHYVAFVEVCFDAFGDRVKNWITLNEPGLYTYFGYCDGRSPPGRTSSREKEPYIVAHNLLLAHGAAVDIYRRKFQGQQKGLIGISLECEFGIPLTNSSEDKDAAQRRNEFQVSWFLDPIYVGDYPEIMRKNVGSRLPKFSPDEIAMLHGSLDFIGFNHYTSRWTTNDPRPVPNMNSTMILDQRVTLAVQRDNVMIGPRAASVWLYMVPWGLYGLLKWSSERYNAPIYITENGMDYVGDLSLEESLQDTRRIQYYQEYLSAALAAIREEVDVRAYFSWTLMDNFEWTQGFTKRFGLFYVDYNDGQKRYPKDSALWFKQFLELPRTDI